MQSQLDHDAEEHGMQQGNDFFKMERDGDYKVRVMVMPKIIVSRFGKGKCYSGAPYCQAEALAKDNAQLTYRYMVWIIDRSTGKFALYEMPLTIYKAIAKLQKNEEYAFDEFPMPYDITINAEKAGTKEVRYQVAAARKNTEVTPEEMAILSKQKSVEDIVERMKVKAKEDYEKNVPTMADVQAAADEDAPNPEDIPF